MNIEEAKKIAADRYNSNQSRVYEAMGVLADALRAAEGQVAQMREDAARVLERYTCRDACDCCVRDRAVADAIRALPAPAGTTAPASDYPTDAEAAADFAAYSMPSAPAPDPAPAVALVAALKPGPVRGPKRCPGCDVQEGLPCHGHCPDLRERVATPKPEAAVPMFQPKPRPTPFDAEAALVAAREAARTGLDLNPTVEARQIAHLLRRMLSDALAAGRGAR